MRTALAALALVLAPPAIAQPAADASAAVTHALLINGGSKPASNYLSHLNHLQEMVDLLEVRGIPRERIHIFSADGEDREADLAVRDTQPEGFWLVEGTPLGRQLRPRTEVTDTIWPEVTLRPAKKRALEKWFRDASDLRPGDRLLVFVTDHGTGNTKDPDNGAISLWGEDLTVDELRRLLGRLRPDVQTVMVMSQCFSGTFEAAIYGDSGGEPSGDTCGFFSTTRDRKAYGCYPEGVDRDRIGHAFRFIDALGRVETAERAHLEVLLTDNTPDVPVRTSELYLERLLADEAKARGVELDALADTLLAEAWRDRAAWEPEIRLLDRIGETFGTFSPRSLAELERYDRELPSVTEKMKTYAGRWKATLGSVKEETLRKFVAESSEWRDLLAEDRLKKLDADERGALLERLLPELEWFARDRPALWARLERLRENAKRASEARWRLEVRAAALRRMRSVLLGVAGRVFLEAEDTSRSGRRRRAAQRQTFESLRGCEDLAPGELPARLAALPAPPIERYPPLAEELLLLEEILPSWLGVRFAPVPEVLLTGRELPAGASVVQAVYPDSPAAAAGLEIGDLLLGPPDEPFGAQGQLREWTMTSPRETPLEMQVVRPGLSPAEDESFLAALILEPLPLEWPELPGPPQVGEAAPGLPSDLSPVGSSVLPALEGRPRLLFFWATWCLPCKAAVPEVLAFSAARGIPVVAITDEDETVVSGYLEKREEEFFDLVATDPLRRSFISYGVSGTPTMVLVGEGDTVEYRQTGYKASDGLSLPGWKWSQSQTGETGPAQARVP